MVSSGKNPIITSQHFVIQLVWKNSGLLLLSVALNSKHDGTLSQTWSLQRARVPIGRSTLRFLVSGDIAMSWLAVETSDMPYVLKLASGDLTSWAAGDAVSQLESSWDGAVYTTATLPATVWCHCESLVQTGLKRERDNRRDKIQAGVKTGRGGASRVASWGVSCYS